jgi:TPP-dependent pyruvate/acetoin dehydrogenase alpha subunit
MIQKSFPGGNTDQEDEVEIPREVLVDMLEKMLLIRIVEEKIIGMYREGIKGLYHLSIGQEAVAAGVCAALKRDDYIFTTHRGKGHYIAKGGDIKALFAEFLEKETGCNRAKGGPMHIVDPSVGMLGANGIVGASIPLACGAAFSAKMRKSGQVGVAFFGDGAANSGPCFESMNLAGLWKLPVIFVCENNLYQGSVLLSDHSSVRDLHCRAEANGFPGCRVDGMNVAAVYEASVNAVQRARGGEGPTFLECVTYRFRGHSEADPQGGLSYRSKEEIASWGEKCPIEQARVLLLARGWITDGEIEAMRSRCRKVMEEGVAFAENSPGAPAEWALKDIYTTQEETT